MSSSINTLNVNENLNLPAVPRAPQDLHPHLEPFADAEIALADHAEVIRELAKRGIGDVIEIGRRLTEAKKLAGHGGWLLWLQHEFGWSNDTALNFMRVYELSKFRNFRNLNLPISALFLVARPSTSEKARNEILQRADHGERFTFDQIKKIISGHKTPAHEASLPATKKAKNKPALITSMELIKFFDNAPEEIQNALLVHVGPKRILRVQQLRSFFQDSLDRQCARVAPKVVKRAAA